MSADGIVYSTGAPGRPRYVGSCIVRWLGWDYRRGSGPNVQYRMRCDAHGAEWSGGVNGCRFGSPIRSVDLTFAADPVDAGAPAPAAARVAIGGTGL